MKLLRFVAVGFVFGIVLTKSEAVSWFRIQEMFHFASFHMFGIIGVAVITGILGLQWIKRSGVKDVDGNAIYIQDKEPGNLRYWIGGTIFGLGWALAGTCPGPIFILVGSGFVQVLWVFLGALIGTFLYGVFKDKLPH